MIVAHLEVFNTDTPDRSLTFVRTELSSAITVLLSRWICLKLDDVYPCEAERKLESRQHV
jgi:hypothetical protein